MNPDNNANTQPGSQPQQPVGPGFPPQPGQDQQPYQQPAAPQYAAPQPPVQPWQTAQPYQPSDPQLPQPQVPTGVGGGSQPIYQTPNNNRNKVIAIVVVVGVVLVAAIATAIVLGMSGDDNKKKTGDAAKESTSQSEAMPISDLDDVTLVPPTDLSKYKANSLNGETTMAYTTTDDKCALQLGVTDAETLPGSSLEEIVDTQIKALRDAGVTINAPTAGEALELADASDNSKKYSLPTLVFAANQDGKSALSHYSAAVLKDGNRVYITRVCQSTDGEVKADAVAPLNADATKITVKVK